MSMYDEQIAGKTKAGKKVAYRVPEGKSLYEIYFVGGGQVPKVLQGAWTDVRMIKNAVTAYLSLDTYGKIKALK